MITKKLYGTTADGVAVAEYTLANGAGMAVTIITYGGIITSIRVPGRDGRVANVALGLASLREYERRAPTSAPSRAGLPIASRRASSRSTAQRTSSTSTTGRIACMAD